MDSGYWTAAKSRSYGVTLRSTALFVVMKWWQALLQRGVGLRGAGRRCVESRKVEVVDEDKGAENELCYTSCCCCRCFRSVVMERVMEEVK